MKKNTFFGYLLFILIFSTLSSVAQSMTRVPDSAKITDIREGLIIILKVNATTDYISEDDCAGSSEFNFGPLWINVTNKGCTPLTVKKDEMIVLRNVKREFNSARGVIESIQFDAQFENDQIDRFHPYGHIYFGDHYDPFKTFGELRERSEGKLEFYIQ